MKLKKKKKTNPWRKWPIPLTKNQNNSLAVREREIEKGNGIKSPMIQMMQTNVNLKRKKIVANKNCAICVNEFVAENWKTISLSSKIKKTKRIGPIIYKVYAADLPPCLNADSLCSSYEISISVGRFRLSFNRAPMLIIRVLSLFEVQTAVCVCV